MVFAAVNAHMVKYFKEIQTLFCLFVFFFILISSDISWLIVTLRQCHFPQIWRACYKLETSWYGGENRQPMSRAFNLQVFFFIIFYCSSSIGKELNEWMNLICKFFCWEEINWWTRIPRALTVNRWSMGDNSRNYDVKDFQIVEVRWF